jgi:hypothetical protein
MTRRDPDLDPELEAFLEARKIERRAPPDVRARALVRARAIVAAGGAVPRVLRTELPPPVPLRLSVPAGRGRGLVRLTLAASMAVTAGAVCAFAALRSRAVDTPPRASPAVLDSPHLVAAVRNDSEPTTAGKSSTVASPHAVTARPTGATRAAGATDLFTAELDLLHRAHAAYTRRDFSGALTLVAEHARRFSKSHLAEQREALRVQSLLGSGRRDEAHHAASAFAVSFPRSVLLPRVEEDAKASE